MNSTKEWDGQPLPDYPDGQAEIKVLRIRIPAGVTLPWHYHPVINAAVILEGRLELYLKGGTTRVFGPGEALVEVVNTVHAGKALGTDDVDLVVFKQAARGSRQLFCRSDTDDLARLMQPQVDPLSCSGFAEAIIQRF